MVYVGGSAVHSSFMCQTTGFVWLVAEPREYYKFVEEKFLMIYYPVYRSKTHNRRMKARKTKP